MEADPNTENGTLTPVHLSFAVNIKVTFIRFLLDCLLWYGFIFISSVFIHPFFYHLKMKECRKRHTLPYPPFSFLYLFAIHSHINVLIFVDQLILIKKAF